MIQIDLPMPESCHDCPLNYDFCWCEGMTKEAWDVHGDAWNDQVCENDHRPEYCPLKEQEAVEPFHRCIGKDFSLIEDSHFDYCPYCGKPITWAKQEGR